MTSPEKRTLPTQPTLEDDARRRLAVLAYGNDPQVLVTDRQPEWASMMVHEVITDTDGSTDKATPKPVHPWVQDLRNAAFWGTDLLRQPEWARGTLRDREFPDEP
jgi:hypothetical protein